MFVLGGCVCVCCVPCGRTAFPSKDLGFFSGLHFAHKIIIRQVPWAQKFILMQYVLWKDLRLSG